MEEEYGISAAAPVAVAVLPVLVGDAGAGKVLKRTGFNGNVKGNWWELNLLLIKGLVKGLLPGNWPV